MNSVGTKGKYMYATAGCVQMLPELSVETGLEEEEKDHLHGIVVDDGGEICPTFVHMRLMVDERRGNNLEKMGKLAVAVRYRIMVTLLRLDFSKKQRNRLIQTPCSIFAKRGLRCQADMYQNIIRDLQE